MVSKRMMEIRRLHPEASIIIITAYATVDTPSWP